MLSGKISCCILTEINPEFWSRPTRQKQILTGLLVTKIYKNRTMKISLFNYSMLGYISPITTSLLHIYRRNSCPTQIFKPTHQTGKDFKHHPTQEYFSQIYHYLGTAVQIIRIWKWKQNSDENFVLLEFKYLQNKKWLKQAVNSARTKKSYRTYWHFSFHSDNW